MTKKLRGGVINGIYVPGEYVVRLKIYLETHDVEPRTQAILWQALDEFLKKRGF